MKLRELQSTKSFKSAATNKVADNIGEYVFGFRRPFKNEILSAADKNYFLSVVREKTLPFIERGNPIEIAIVGFSVKCPSPTKVLTQNADCAEFESLKHLKNFTDGFSRIYKPGAKLDIFADGRMFARTIFGVNDEKVTRYISQLKLFLNKLKADKLRIHTAEDFYSGSFDEVRSSLVKNFPPDIEKLKTDIFIQEYRKFMRDFYAKDIRAQDRTVSIKKSKILGEEVANNVINLADSYGNFIDTLYKQGMLRLSVHAKPVNDISKKIGLFLNELKVNCPMPWHGAAVHLVSKKGFLFEKKSILEQAGAKLTPADNSGISGGFYTISDSVPFQLTKYFK